MPTAQKLKCDSCASNVKGKHFEMLGLSYGENHLGMPVHLIQKLPAIYCSTECLFNHLVYVVKGAKK